MERNISFLDASPQAGSNVELGASLASWMAMAQGLMYVITGVWPIISRRSFELVTGPKVDFWLVKTVGALITVIGGVLMLAGWRQRNSHEPEVAALAIGSAASLAGADVIFVSQQRIRKIYLLDALVEAGIIVGWILALSQRRTR
jgi:hypothetical protein